MKNIINKKYILTTNIIIVLFYQFLIPSSSHSGQEHLKQKLKNDGYFCKENGAALDIFGIKDKDRNKLLTMINNSPSENNETSEHFGEKNQLIFVSMAKNDQNQDIFHIKNSTTQDKEVNAILKTAALKLSELTEERPIGIEFKFFKDTSPNREALFWHQDVWGWKVDPRYLAFAVLDRSPKATCNHTISVAQELGLVDHTLVPIDYLATKNPDAFIDDKPLLDSPDYQKNNLQNNFDGNGQISKNVSLLARQCDAKDSGYVINQFRVTSGKKIVHRRTRRETCHCFRHRTTLVARVRSLKHPLLLPDPFLRAYLNDELAKQLCKDSLKPADTSVLEKLVDDRHCLELDNIDFDEGPGKYLALIARDENNVFHYVFKDSVDPLKEDLSIFTTASILIRLLKNNNGRVVGKEKFKWDNAKKAFVKYSTNEFSGRKRLKRKPLSI